MKVNRKLITYLTIYRLILLYLLPYNKFNKFQLFLFVVQNLDPFWKIDKIYNFIF